MGKAAAAVLGKIFGGIAGGAASGASMVVLIYYALDGIRIFLSWILNGLGALLTFILYEFSPVIGFYNNPFVQTGWSVVRDVANWFFIVFLLIAAISTILDIPSYNARKVLPRLIVAALLVNFSLFITAFSVNVAQGFMSIFVGQLAAQYEDIGQVYINGMKIANVATFDPSISGGFFTEKLTDVAVKIGGKIATIFFLLFAIYIFAFLVVALIYRFVILWMLIILSPLAFVSAVLPATQAFWNRWFKDFTRWTVFAPIMVFFLWLGTYLLFYLDTIEPALTGFQANPELTAGILQFAHRLLRFAVVLIFLYLTVRVARELANEAATAADRVAKSVTAGVGLAPIVIAGRGAALGRVGLLRMGVPAKIGAALQESPVAQRLRFPAYVGRTLTATQRSADAERWQREEGRLANFTVDDLRTAARARGVAGAVATNKLLERNIPIDFLGGSAIAAHMKTANRLRQDTLMKTARADIARSPAARIFKNIGEVESHFARLRPSDAPKIQAASLDNEDTRNAIVKAAKANWSPAHLSQILSSDNSDLVIKFRDLVVPELEKDARYRKYFASPAGKVWT